MDEKIRQRAEVWTRPPYDEATCEAVLKMMKENPEECADAFYRDLEFGTGGLRGVLGIGTNRMNQYVVALATQGFANYLQKQCKEEGLEKQVAVSYDCRNGSSQFALTTAKVFAANGFKVYLFTAMRPTPVLSFAVRYYHCCGGVMVTASHNPKEYNGYKAYGSDGGQLVSPHDKNVMAEVAAITSLDQVRMQGGEDLIRYIDEELDNAYLEKVVALSLDREAVASKKDMKIVYTPLHGTGNIPARRVMKEIGFENVYVVPEQELPDGDFPTVSYPNPEAEEAFTLGLALAKEKNADLVLATDPDADRLGVYVKDAKTGEYHPLTGNMSGSLLCDYVLSQKQAKGQIPADGQVIKSIVTTNLLDAVAAHYGCQLVEVLTGFKYIGQQILKEEQTGKGTYMFGMEESYGCLIGTYARDKDAISATAALCEAAAYYKEKGMTLWDAMIAMYEKYGYYNDTVKSIGLKGIEGLAKIQEIMETFRKNPPKELGGYHVASIRDYKADTITDTATGAVAPTGLPESNVLYYDMNDGAWLCVRPSGTEPKIKFYYGVKGTSMEDAKKKSDAMGDELMAMVNKML